MHNTKKISIVTVLLVMLAGCSRFHMKIVDQHGQPVPEVKIEYGSVSCFFIACSGGSRRVSSNTDGRFTTSTPRISVHYIRKSGYEFSREDGYGSSYVLGGAKGKINTYSDPYIIMAWKRDSPEKLIGGEGSGKLTPDSRYYAIDLSTRHRYPRALPGFLNVNDVDADLLVKLTPIAGEPVLLFGKVIPAWEFEFLVPKGGLIETEDIFRNIAPESGYSQRWTIKSTDIKRSSRSFERMFYLKSRDGQLYGQFKMEFSPRYNSIDFDEYWLNPNGSRNLIRPKKYAYCLRNTPRPCSLDDYNP